MFLKRNMTEEIDSFYSSPATGNKVEYCSGTACFVARGKNPARFSRGYEQKVRTYCLGKCYEAPSSSEGTSIPIISAKTSPPVVLENIVRGPADSLARYKEMGGFKALRKALEMKPVEIVEEVERSSLRGRGGAGFPTGKKWSSVLSQDSREKYVVVNADEGDPGAYIDRLLLELDPFRILEATIIAGYATGASNAYIYIRREYPEAIKTVSRAVQEMIDGGFIGSGILGSGFSIDVHIVPGKGSYVCGEETALIRSIEGRRPEVALRPPYPTEKGLYDKPTVVNNVETLANIPWIINNGAARFAEIGFSKSRGTKAVSLNSLFRNPGLYEVEMGTTIDHVVNDIGGGLKSGKIKGIIVGGPIAGIIPPSKFGTRIGYEEMKAIGGELGHGGFVAFDEETSIKDLISHVSSFVAYESCGKCTPCRLGSRTVEEVFSGLQTGDRWTREDYEALSDALLDTSLCGLGGGLGEFLKSASENYHEEVDACFA
ncbi:NADH dehydrogenase I subunit F [Thermoplasmatales archaeon]|nr:NADH dehydrogenase I subunit F [Thermoplasmatales archaeon]